MMRIDILTLFPLFCDNALRESVIGRAREKGLFEVHCHDIRDYTENKHRRVDDTPYGGGMGMLMEAQPIALCFESVCDEIGERPYFIYMSPQGKVLTQEKAVSLSHKKNIALLCGHYEGVDERLIEELVDEEISIGDFVLTGGELPALVLTDCVVRMLPGVLSDDVCFTEESHYSRLLEYPQYTRPLSPVHPASCLAGSQSTGGTFVRPSRKHRQMAEGNRSAAHGRKASGFADK